MSTIVSSFFNKIKENYSAMRFKRYRQSCYRVVNDVIQSISAQTIMSGKGFRVEFGIYPLCGRISSPFITSYNLEDFDPIPFSCSDNEYVELSLRLKQKNEYRYIQGWIFDNHSDDSIDMLLSRVFTFVEHIIIPYFEKGVDSKTGLSETLRLETVLYQVNKRKYDLQKTWPENVELIKTNSFLYALREMAIKCKVYELAIDSFLEEIRVREQMLNNSLQLVSWENNLIEIIIQNMDDINQLNHKDSSFFLPFDKTVILYEIKKLGIKGIISKHDDVINREKEYRRGVELNIQQCKEWIGHLKNNDKEWIESVIRNNEQYSREMIERNFR